MRRPNVSGLGGTDLLPIGECVTGCHAKQGLSVRVAEINSEKFAVYEQTISNRAQSSWL